MPVCRDLAVIRRGDVVAAGKRFKIREMPLGQQQTAGTRTALAHSVGAGWRSGGTPPTQTRHMPAGGAYRVGTDASS